jgi:hypothetical protein
MAQLWVLWCYRYWTVPYQSFLFLLFWLFVCKYIWTLPVVLHIYWISAILWKVHIVSLILKCWFTPLPHIVCDSWPSFASVSFRRVRSNTAPTEI